MGQILALSLREHPQSEASTIANSQARRETGAFQEESANESQGLAAEQDHEWAWMSQDEANSVAEQMAEAEHFARREQVPADTAIAAWVEVAGGTEEVQEEHEQVQKMREDAERTMAAAREEAEKPQKAADEQRREADAADTLAEECIQPVVTPSLEELAAAKRRIQYNEDYCFHSAVAGISVSGKSSLVNAFRGLRSRDVCAAAVGVTESALQVTQYPDANPENPFVWYEIPGAGAVKLHGWQYFIDQGLYIFDSIVILFDNRFTLTDIAILANARRFNIPTYIVRSKADQSIQNIMLDMGYDSDDDNEDVERRNELYDAARKQFIEATRKSVQANLENANLPDQRVYIVSSNTLLSAVRKKTPKKTIDEVELLHDLFSQVCTRRRVAL